LARVLDAVAPVLDAMLALGLRLSQELVDETLNLAGEK
jgi:predicted nucleic acid-binding protein